MASSKNTPAKGKDKTPVNTVPMLPEGHYEAGESISVDDRLYVSPDDGKLYTDGLEVDFLGVSRCNCIAGIVLKLDEYDFTPSELLGGVAYKPDADYEIVDERTAEQSTADAAWERAETVEGDGQIPLIATDDTLLRTSFPVMVQVDNRRAAELLRRALADRSDTLASLATKTRKEGYTRAAAEQQNDRAILTDDLLSQLEEEQELPLQAFGSLSAACAHAVLATVTEFVASADSRKVCAQRIGDVMATFGRTVASMAHARGVSERLYSPESVCLDALGNGATIVRDVNAE